MKTPEYSGEEGPCQGDLLVNPEIQTPGDSEDEEFFDAIEGVLSDGNLEGPPDKEEGSGNLHLGISSKADIVSKAIRTLETKFIRCLHLNAEELNLEPAVYVHEGSDVLSQLKDQLVMLPEVHELSPKCDIEKADVGEPGKTSPEEERKLRGILKSHRSIFLGDGNAAPAPAR
ncbi:Reverse transcriptase, partial [Phytophthora palmivora]